MAKDDNIFLKLLKTLAAAAIFCFITMPLGIVGGVLTVGGVAGAATGAGVAPGAGMAALGLLLLGIAGASLKASTNLMKDVLNMEEDKPAPSRALSMG